jgi:hypothetical protein
MPRIETLCRAGAQSQLLLCGVHPGAVVPACAAIMYGPLHCRLPGFWQARLTCCFFQPVHSTQLLLTCTLNTFCLLAAALLQLLPVCPILMHAQPVRQPLVIIPCQSRRCWLSQRGSLEPAAINIKVQPSEEVEQATRGNAG